MKLLIVVISSMVLLSHLYAFGEVRLPRVFGSNMVLQRDMPVPIWGWACANENVTITLIRDSNGETVSTLEVVADEKGDWKSELPSTEAGGPYTLTVDGGNTVKLSNILFGEVWVCSGQSNMEWPVNASDNSQDEIAAADYPNIRLFHIPRVASGLPMLDVDAQWRTTTPDNIRHFSAVAYYFGRHLYNQLDIPIGLINTSWGGTRIEPWTPPIGFDAIPALSSISDEINDIDTNYRAQLPEKITEIEEWISETKDAIENNSTVIQMPENIHPLTNSGRPTSLYNAMIYPIVPYAIRGALWYQGESNMPEGMMYHEKMKALISGWRDVWGQGEFPFYFVQLAPFNYGGQDDETERLARLWEAQSATLSVANTGMVVTTDVGNIRDIHPRNKQAVGLRLALWALGKTYGKNDIVYSGPLYKSMQVEGESIRCSFDHIGGGLTSSDDQSLTWFEIAGEDKQFYKANAVVDGDSVVVSSENVSSPVAVRFGWDQIAEPNLINKEGLPASPFRTDSW
ncbi:9-O-acetylesterase [Candidatus Poribacteria bacterium]|nr:9-O-acetylesterase [Candidatus Poribacteria bacterium]